MSPALLAELREVLFRPKFRRYGSEADVVDFVDQFADAQLMADPPNERLVPDDPDDDYLMALGRRAGVDYLVSGDRHLTQLLDPRPPVLRPREFHELLGEEASRL